MKNTKELYAYFKENLLPDLRKLENQRKKIVQKILLAGIILLLIIIGSVYFIWQNTTNYFVFFIPVVICGIIFFFVYSMLIKGYVGEFKDKIIRRIITFIDKNLNYQKANYIPESEFIGSKIFNRKPDRYKGDDFVQGTIGSTAMKFSEIHAEYKTETRDSKGRKQTHWHTIFKGLMFIADFNKNFNGTTVVLPDKAEKMLGWLGQKLQSMNITRGELIKLEDPEFEKLFVVYGDDQIEARYILSPSLMKRIVEFKKKTGKNVFFSFAATKIFAAVSYRKNLFEPRVFRTLLDFEPIREYFEDLQLAIGIVEDLNLNTRIWSKQ